MSKKDINWETPFDFLRRKSNGQKFDNNIVDNWYKSRAFVLDKLKDITIKPHEDIRLHVVIWGDDGLMLSIVRNVALYAHFVNYDEANGENRTLITLVSQKDNIVDELKKEEYLGNLPIYGKRFMRGVEPQINTTYVDVDIELEVVPDWPQEDKNNEHIINIHKEDVISFKDIRKSEIDTRKAQYTDRMYRIGTEIDNLAYVDIHSAERYTLAMNVFQKVKMKDELKGLVKSEEWEVANNQALVLEGLSNILCSDCFITKYNSIKQLMGKKKKSKKQVWKENLDILSRSEHARWVVEKLIMGYRPYTQQERLRDEVLISNNEKRKQVRKQLKNNWNSPAHIDLCSYSELRRIDPDNMKYDSFLVLGIPKILKRVKELP